ncbi:MAG: DUF1460 domain-containing protein [Gammaproteobacteria bacterium]|nr:DUF1460 domain-containing protein [Gammaproteobacteria bacterium]
MIKKIVSIFLLSLILFSCATRETDEQWLSAMPKPWQLSKQQLNDALPQFDQRFPDFNDRLRALALWRVGTPYEIFKLGEERAPDFDPIFRLDVSDCTSHVLTSLSLAQSNSWDEAQQNMIKIHYKPDQQGKKIPTYKSRWHFTSDRIMNHPSTPAISTRYIDNDKLVVQSITLNLQDNGKELLKLGWSLDADVQYIPNEQITAELLSKLPKIAGVAFVKPKYFSKGLINAHEGMIVDGAKLLHAGQVAGETVVEDFMKYYFTDKGPRFGGIMLFEFIPQSQ